jgi:ankyrin repeat protein
MAPDMLDTLSPTIRKYVTERLEHTYLQSKQNEQKASSAFSLAVEALRHSHEPNSESDCLMWLVRSAQAGSQSAQSLVVRFHRTFNRDVPLNIQNEVKDWIISTAERNFPASQEDLHLLCTLQERSNVWSRIRSGYTNTGWNRFGGIYKDTETTMEKLGQGLRERLVRQMQSPCFDPRDFDLNESGDNVLHLAAFAGLGAVISLWKNPMPIDINILGRSDESALLHACRSGHFEEAMMLLELGADPKLASATGYTPLHWLLNFERLASESLARRLSEAGADVNAVAKELRYPWSPLCNYEGGTPLHRAVGRGKADAVKALLHISAAANHSGARNDKKCPIYLATQFYYPEILDMLLRSLGTQAPAAKPYRGFSLLVAAIHGNDLYGLKFSMVARHGEQWLSNLHKTVDVLLEHGAAEHLHNFPEGFDCAKTTPLQSCGGTGRPRSCRIPPAERMYSRFK